MPRAQPSHLQKRSCRWYDHNSMHMLKLIKLNDEAYSLSEQALVLDYFWSVWNKRVTKNTLSNEQCCARANYNALNIPLYRELIWNIRHHLLKNNMKVATGSCFRFTVFLGLRYMIRVTKKSTRKSDRIECIRSEEKHCLWWKTLKSNTLAWDTSLKTAWH